MVNTISCVLILLDSSSSQFFQGASFEVDHVEVWGLGPAVDADEERQNVRPRQPNLEIRAGDVDEADLMSQLM